MKWFLISVVTCAVAFYIRFLWALQADLRHRSKNRSDKRRLSRCPPLLNVNIADVLAQTPSNPAPSRVKKF